jgi:hypothetical protein
MTVSPEIQKIRDKFQAQSDARLASYFASQAMTENLLTVAK